MPFQGLVSRAAGSAWLASGRTALLAVPSVIIEGTTCCSTRRIRTPAALAATKLRRFVYDPRV
jgi:hypothetical protein